MSDAATEPAAIGVGQPQPVLIFAQESLTSLAEALPLLKAHWQEVAHYPDIPLNPDVGAYQVIERVGALRCYAARRAGALVGYAVFFVRANPHYMESVQAVQDVLYLDPAARGHGLKFIAWCDEQLKAEGVQAVYHHIKATHNFGKALERLGYELVDHIYARRLDR